MAPPRPNLYRLAVSLAMASLATVALIRCVAPPTTPPLTASPKAPAATAPLAVSAAPAVPAPATKPAVIDPLASQLHTTLAFIDKNCVECHNAEDHLGDLVLDSVKNTATIRKNRKQWERVLTMVGGNAMPPKAHPQPAPADRTQFLSATKTILNYTDPNRPDPGRVTLRRLNRNEYDNTVYELLGISFYPSADFPPDDVGGGYDNNGDTLSLSPLLMERYLTAAESVIQEAFPEGGSWPIFQKNDNFLPAAGGALFKQTSLGRDKIRHILPGMRLAYTQTAQSAIKTEGDYLFRAFAYFHEGAGLDVPSMVLEVDDQPLQTFTVNNLGYEAAAFYKAPIHLKPGPHKFAVYWPLKEGQTTPDVPFDRTGKVEPPGLHMRWTEVVGPRVETPTEKLVLAHKADAPPRDAAREVVNRFASLAFRRPASAAEVDRLLTFYDSATLEGADWYDAVRQPLTAILVSPNFLFRVETDDQPEATGPHPITDLQLASRLSYFLWSSMPDQELMTLAAKNELHTQLEAQVRRMLKDPRADQLTDNFASQWLHLRMLAKVTPDKTRFPQYTDALRAAMSAETLKFFHAIVAEDRSILDLLDGQFTYLNQPLAELYGITDTKGNRAGQANPVPGGTPIRGQNFVRVELQNADRAGILTQASVLTVTSNPGRTSPVKRGKFVLEQILGQAPPPPPPNIPSLDVGEHVIATGTVRQRMEQHRANPSCAACHLTMDAIGFSLENFNPIGQFREKDEQFDIDARGTLPDGTSFNGAAELKAMLKTQSDIFATTLTEQLLTYALGRQMQYYDRPAVDKIARAAAADNYKFSRVIVEIVNSDPFRMRRGKDQTDE